MQYHKPPLQIVLPTPHRVVRVWGHCECRLSKVPTHWSAYSAVIALRSSVIAPIKDFRRLWISRRRPWCRPGVFSICPLCQQTHIASLRNILTAICVASRVRGRSTCRCTCARNTESTGSFELSKLSDFELTDRGEQLRVASPARSREINRRYTSPQYLLLFDAR